ncbi:hypothetical protein HKX48_003855 [Thoreauomyces humboldtii]|nr:hypothetical protein HKX48_003855 [Thoreauomyces humboldtii]
MDLVNIIPSFGFLEDAPLKPILLIGLYFALLGTALVICFSRALRSLPYSSVSWALLPLAIASLYVTWTEIVSWLFQDYTDFVTGNGPYDYLAKVPGSATFDDWVRESDWFVAAYRAVTEDAYQWWWSAQLLNTAAVIVAFFWSEGPHNLARKTSEKGGMARRAGLASALAFVCVGFLGAMSTAFSLFLIQRQAAETEASSTASLYTFLAVANLVSLLVTSSRLLNPHRSLLLELSTAIFANSCQKSITADLFFCTAISIVFSCAFLRNAVAAGSVTKVKAFGMAALVLVSIPVVGVSVVLPAFLAWREGLVRLKVREIRGDTM